MRPTAGGSLDVARSIEPPGVDLLDGSPYRVVGELGAGGMGEVLEAEHVALGHRVVAKVMREELAARPEMLDRMRVEAQSLARIRHPNLVMVTDCGQTRSGRPFLVMERLHGRSLQEELHDRSSLPVAEAAEIGRQILLGLSAAHAAGLVHRDVKPDNVFLCATGDGRPQVKVLDFGVVKVAQAGRDPRTPQPPVVPTAENVALGTPRYFSPEQTYAARDLDARSDLYSVGLVLYTTVVGHGPFDHYRRCRDLFVAHVSEAPMPPSVAAPQAVPAAFDRIVLRALAKRREERFPDALAFAEELSRFLSSLGAEGHRVNATVQLPEDEQETIEIEEREGAEAAEAGIPDGLATTRREALSPGAAAPSRPEDPTATASPIAAPRGDVAPTRRDVAPTRRDVAPTRQDVAPGKLPEGPVMIDRLVQRVLGSALAPAAGTVPLPRGAVEQTAPLAPAAGTVPLPRGAVEQTAPLPRGEVGQTAPLGPLPPSRPSSPEPTALDLAAAARPPAPSPTEPMPALNIPPARVSSPGRASWPGIPGTAPMFGVGPAAAAWPTAPGAASLSAPLRAPASPAIGAWTGPVIAGAAVFLVLLGALLGYLLR